MTQKCPIDMRDLDLVIGRLTLLDCRFTGQIHWEKDQGKLPKGRNPRIILTVLLVTPHKNVTWEIRMLKPPEQKYPGKKPAKYSVGLWGVSGTPFKDCHTASEVAKQITGKVRP